MKILMVGLGGIGQRHVRNMRTLMGHQLDLIAYRFRNDTRVLTEQLEVEEGSDLAQKYSIRVFDELGKALDQRPDVVFVCNPTSLHIPIALQAATAGCHLFIEKPLSHNMQGVQDLIDLIETKRLRAAVGYQMRFHPCLTRLHALIEEQAIGRILSVRAEVGEYLAGWHAYEDYRQMYASRNELGGGVILTQIHELDYVTWLFGLPTRVFAVGGHLSQLEIDVEDTVDILMEHVKDGNPIPVSVHLDYVQRPPRRSCEIVGDSGKIIADLRRLTVDVFDRQGELVEAASYEGYPRNRLFLDETKRFLEFVRGGDVQLVTVSEAARSLRIAVAAKKSLETAQVIQFTEW